ncbi:MAG: twitching motility protein PilT, partial [Actinomycetota bacterium]|nr:twitching motility protein PilT [Actinomycetota bacterium]
MANVHEYLRFLVDEKASDLHVKAGGPPYVRLNGDLRVTEFPALTATDCEQAAADLMDEEQARKFEEKGEVDFAFSEQGLGRFRINVFRQRGSIGIACRRVLPGSPAFETLGLPPVVKTLADEQRGLILVTGPTSSGKTT